MTDRTGSEHARWHRLETLFEACRGLTPNRRAEYLDVHCADDAALRGEVESLLLHVDSFAAEDETLVEFLVQGRKVDKYEIEGVLAAGGMGIVYRARQREPERAVALKVLQNTLASDAARQRFQYEAEVLARLQHPGIAQIHDAGVISTPTSSPARGGIPYFVMELVAGAKTIDRSVRERSRDREHCLELMIQLCDAVQHGHQRGVIHRDLKPGNVLVDESGRVRVIDFGVARIVEPEARDHARLTQAGELVGTPAYMSPEQAATGDVDTRSDVYSLGVVLYELLSGQLPYRLDAGNLLATARTIQSTPPRLPSALDPRLGGDLEVVLLKALAKDPDQRYGSAGALGADLLRVLRGEPIVARRPTFGYVFGHLMRRHRIAAWAVIVTGFVAVGAGVATTVALWQAKEASAGESRALAQAELELAYSREEAMFFDMALDRILHNLEPVQFLPILSHLEQLFESNSGGLASLRLAQAFESLGAIEEAESLAVRAEAELHARFGPNHPMALEAKQLRTLLELGHLRGRAFQEPELLSPVEQSFREILTRLESGGHREDAIYGAVLSQLGASLVYQHRWSEAESVLRDAERVAQSESTKTSARSTRAQMLEWSGRFDEARELLWEIYDSNRVGTVGREILFPRHRLAAFLFRAGEWGEAERIFHEGLDWVGDRVYPEMVSYRYDYCFLLSDARRFSDLEIQLTILAAHLDQLPAERPQHRAMCALYRAQIRAAEGQASEAGRMASAALDEVREHIPLFLPLALDLIGLGALSDGDPERALVEFETGLRHHRGYRRDERTALLLELHRARALIGLGRMDEAFQSLDELETRWIERGEPFLGDLYDVLRQFYLATGENGFAADCELEAEIAREASIDVVPPTIRTRWPDRGQ